MKKEFLKKSKLYLILDTNVASYDELVEKAQSAVSCGVDIVQIRDKGGLPEDTIRFTRCIKNILPDTIPLIMNDRADFALETEVDGVHIGQHDLSVKEVRRVLGPLGIIGVSCQRLDQAVLAEEDGADYIGFGSVYKTLTKPDREPMDLNMLRVVVAKIKIPVFAIGGINAQNIIPLLTTGVKRIAVTRAILNADNAGEESQKLKNFCESSSVAELQLPKLVTRVRFPSLAPDL